MCYLAINGYLSCASLLCLVFLISIAVIIITNRSLIDYSDKTDFNDIEIQKKEPVVKSLERELED